MAVEQAGTGGIRILVTDDHVVVRRGLRAYVETVPTLEVIGEAERVHAALAAGTAGCVLKDAGPEEVARAIQAAAAGKAHLDAAVARQLVLPHPGGTTGHPRRPHHACHLKPPTRRIRRIRRIRRRMT